VKLLSAYYFAMYLSFSVFLPYTSLYFSEKGFSDTAVGVILSLWSFVSLIAQPAMGMIDDRMRNPRIVLMVSVITAPLIGIGFLYVHQLALVIALSVAFSWFQSSTSPLADSIAVEMAGRKGISFGNIGCGAR
jgi:PPP family 3-phenylpropionic acid transporter